MICIHRRVHTGSRRPWWSRREIIYRSGNVGTDVFILHFSRGWYELSFLTLVGVSNPILRRAVNSTRDYERVVSAAMVPPLYHNLKMVAHGSLGIYVILGGYLTDPPHQLFPSGPLTQFYSRWVSVVDV